MFSTKMTFSFMQLNELQRVLFTVDLPAVKHTASAWVRYSNTSYQLFNCLKNKCHI